MPEICDTLAQLNDAGYLPVKSLERALGIAPRSGYRYVNGAVVDAQQLRRLFTASEPGVHQQAVQTAIINFLFVGTDWRAQRIERDPIDTDEDFDTRAAFDQCIASMRKCAEALEMFRTADKVGLSRLDQEDAEVLMAEISRAATKAATASKAIVFLRTAQAKAATP